MNLDALPEHWQRCLLDIAANRRSLWTGIACLEGGGGTVAQLIDFGACTLMSDPRYVTLTPWGAQALLDVEPFEYDDESEPIWVRSAVVRDAIGDSPIVSRGVPGCVRIRSMHAIEQSQVERQESHQVEPVAVKDEWGGVVVVCGITLYRDDEMRVAWKAKADARRKAQREAKARRKARTAT